MLPQLFARISPNSLITITYMTGLVVLALVLLRIH